MSQIWEAGWRREGEGGRRGSREEERRVNCPYSAILLHLGPVPRMGPAHIGQGQIFLAQPPDSNATLIWKHPQTYLERMLCQLLGYSLIQLAPKIKPH